MGEGGGGVRKEISLKVNKSIQLIFRVRLNEQILNKFQKQLFIKANFH